MPLAIRNDRGHFVSSAIRDVEMAEIVDKTLSSQQLAGKAGIGLEQAQHITSVHSVQASWRRRIWRRCSWRSRMSSPTRCGSLALSP